MKKIILIIGCLMCFCVLCSQAVLATANKDVLVENETINDLQKSVLEEVSKNDMETKLGYSQLWVRNIYESALETRKNPTNALCARCAGNAWGVSDDWSKIQIGATVYGTNNGKYGHVGIYIGDGKVAHNVGYLKIDTLEHWIQHYDGCCWGWEDGQNLSKKPEYDIPVQRKGFCQTNKCEHNNNDLI